jgi:hypothetical protein
MAVSRWMFWICSEYCAQMSLWSRQLSLAFIHILECRTFSLAKVYMHTIDILMALHIAYPAKRFLLLRGLAKRQTAVYTSCVEHSYMEI